jgi:membrane protease YdiL (CAAX protease family)
MLGISLDRESARGSVTAFFVGAFAFTWLLQLPGVLAQRGILKGPVEPYLPFAMLGIFGPLVAATVLAARQGGRPAVRELYSGLGRFRVPVTVVVVALFVPALLQTFGLWLFRLAGREGPIVFVPGPERIVLGLVIALAEEVGWRGFALPRLQRRMHPFAASGLIGVLWTFWHIPMFMGAGVPLSLLLVITLQLVGGSLFYTWFYNRSGGSLLLAVLAHFCIHLDNPHSTLPGDTIPLLVSTVVYAALGLGLMLPSLKAPRPGSPVQAAAPRVEHRTGSKFDGSAIRA